MAAYQHPNDGPSPICPGANMSQTNNPTWFAFTAWCTDLSLRVTSTNCHQVGGAIGFQLAIYTSCNFNHVVACNADIQDCNTNDKILNLTGLNIGAVYYFMVDGCLGSYCTVTIDIIGVCGQEVIAPWTQPVSGNMNPCVGNSELYTVEHLNGARIYHWFLDGTLVAQTTTDSFNIHWPTPGTYQLCIDASNDPCVPVTDDPSPLCTTITVHEANAGVLNVSPITFCVAEDLHISTTGYTSGPDNTQMLFITDTNGIIINVINAPGVDFTSFPKGEYTVYAYNVVTLGGLIPTVGQQISDIDCSSPCCDLKSQSISVHTMGAAFDNFVCDDNGTGNDSTDDLFTFTVTVEGFPMGMPWLTSIGIQGEYEIPKLFGPYPISGGPIFFDIYDAVVSSCVLLSVPVVDLPPSCSSCPETIDAGTGSMLNCIDTTITLTGIASSTGLYHWTGPDSFSSDSLVTIISAPGWYYLAADFPNQCSVRDSVFVDQDHDVPVANAGMDQLIDCNHAQVLVDGSGSTGNHLLFTWADEHGVIISTQPSMVVNAGGTYILQVADSVSGCMAVDTAEVVINSNELEKMSSTVFPEICAGDNDGIIEITGVTGGIPPYLFSLNGLIENSAGPFTNLAPGIYNLHISDANGCTLDTFLIVNPGIDLTITLPEVIYVTEDQSTFINAIINVPVGFLSSIEWSPKGILACDTCLSTTIQTLSNQTLQLTVMHVNGCVSTAVVNILVLPKPKIYIPNTFSPNGDGYNDFFTLYANAGVESVLALTIYDRWGEILYQAHDFSPNLPQRGWDGKFHQREMPSGVFVYQITVLMGDGSKKIFTGDVTVVR